MYMHPCTWIEASALIIPFTFKDNTTNFCGKNRSHSSKGVNITCSRRFTNVLTPDTISGAMWACFLWYSCCSSCEMCLTAAVVMHFPKSINYCSVHVHCTYYSRIKQAHCPFNVSENKPFGVQIWNCLSQLQCYVAPNCLWKMQWLATQGTVHCKCFIINVIITHD